MDVVDATACCIGACIVLWALISPYVRRIIELGIAL